MDDVEYWRRRALEAEAKLQNEEKKKLDEATGPRCRDCGVRKACYGLLCGPCCSDYDL